MKMVVSCCDNLRDRVNNNLLHVMYITSPEVAGALPQFVEVEEEP